MITIFYRDRDRAPNALRQAIIACEKQIAIAPRVKELIAHELKCVGLPLHKGFQQLAIVCEKQKNFPEAIRLCREAERQGWYGDWGKRIARCEKKIGKQAGHNFKIPRI